LENEMERKNDLFKEVDLENVFDTITLKAKDLEDEVVAKDIEISNLTEIVDSLLENESLEKEIESGFNIHNSSNEIRKMKQTFEACTQFEAAKAKQRNMYMDKLKIWSATREREHDNLLDKINGLVPDRCWY
jgi:macrodomain Ter protein organizer (MatP/YcbG family)